jgi:hypothetical protein
MHSRDRSYDRQAEPVIMVAMFAGSINPIKAVE